MCRAKSRNAEISFANVPQHRIQHDCYENQCDRKAGFQCLVQECSLQHISSAYVADVSCDLIGVNLSLRNLEPTEFGVLEAKRTASRCPKRDAIGEDRMEMPVVTDDRCLRMCSVFDPDSRRRCQQRLAFDLVKGTRACDIKECNLASEEIQSIRPNHGLTSVWGNFGSVSAAAESGASRSK